MSETSELIQDLSTLPSIVGNLGLSIATAQKEFNLNYLKAVEKIIAMARSMLGDERAKTSEFSEQITGLLKTLAPAHYQYTETELEFRADLAQTLNASIGAGVGANVGAVVVNASVAVGFGYDYRAAAKVRTIIHAVPADKTIMTSLLDRADKLSAQGITPPPQKDLDSKIIETMEGIYQTLTGNPPAEIDEGTEKKTEEEKEKEEGKD